MKLIKQTLIDNIVDHYKIEKINNYKSEDKWQNWEKYAEDCIELLRLAKKQVYYKHCLRVLAPDVDFLPEEKHPDTYIVRTDTMQLNFFNDEE